MGADEYWVTSDKDNLRKNAKTLDFILATSIFFIITFEIYLFLFKFLIFNNKASGNADWDSIIRLLKIDATVSHI